MKTLGYTYLLMAAMAMGAYAVTHFGDGWAILAGFGWGAATFLYVGRNQ